MPKRPPARKKLGQWAPGSRQWIRAEIRNIFTRHKTPAARELALVRQLGSVSTAKNPDKNVVTLLTKMRQREMKKVVKADKVPEREIKTTTRYNARFLRDMKERVFTDFNLGCFHSITGQLSAIEAFGKKRDCREYAADVLTEIAQEMKHKLFDTSTHESRVAVKDAVLQALNKAISLYKELGKDTESRNLEIWANNIAQTM